MTIERELQRRLRGAILKILYDAHQRQTPHIDDSTLFGILRRLQYDVSRADVRRLLQDLKGRGYVRYDRQEAPVGLSPYRLLEITPAGTDVQEGTEKDPAVEVVE